MAGCGPPGASWPACWTAGDLLRQAGKTLIGTVGVPPGRYTAPPFCTPLRPSPEHASSAEALVAALEAAAGGIAALGKASEGEKTMLDALLPAARAARAAPDDGGDVAVIASAAHDAAKEGATATIPMLATN